MMFYKDIRACLESALNSTLNIPTIAWQNVNFDRSQNQSFLECRFIPTKKYPTTVGQNPQEKIQGIFQILVHSPENTGTGINSDIVETLLSEFYTSRDLSFVNEDLETIRVSIESSESRGSYSEPPYYVTPININWYSYR